MRRIVLLLWSILFAVSFVSAGQSHDVDFTETRSQSIFVYNDDEIRFQLLGGEHVIIIEDVGASSIKVDIGPFINNQSILTPGLIGLDYIMKLDLDKDGITDVNIALYSVSADGEVHLVLQDVTSTENGEVITGDVGLVDDSSSDFSRKNLALIGIGVLLLGLIIFLVYKNSNSNGKGASLGENRIEESNDESSPKENNSS